MNQIILASHGGMSAGLKNTLELILGEPPNVHAVATTRDETEPVTASTRRLLDGFAPGDKAYILIDVMGGSVNNDMMTLLADYPDLTVICGTNACLALNLASCDDPITDEELEEFLNQARSQIVNCRKMLQDASAERDDLMTYDQIGTFGLSAAPWAGCLCLDRPHRRAADHCGG